MKKSEYLYFNMAVLALLVILLAACGTSNLAKPDKLAKTQASHATKVPTLTPTPTKRLMQPTPTPKPTPTKPSTQPIAIPSPTLAPISTPISANGKGFVTSSAAAQAVFTLINQERASQGLPALQWSNALVKSAHLHNVLMFQANNLSHQLPGEADMFTRINAQGIPGNQFAENIGYGWGDAVQGATGLNAWMFSEKPPDDGHRLNILSKATIVGVDVIVNPQISQIWLTEDFAEVS